MPGDVGRRGSRRARAGEAGVTDFTAHALQPVQDFDASAAADERDPLVEVAQLIERYDLGLLGFVVHSHYGLSLKESLVRLKSILWCCNL